MHACFHHVLTGMSSLREAPSPRCGKSPASLFCIGPPRFDDEIFHWVRLMLVISDQYCEITKVFMEVFLFLLLSLPWLMSCVARRRDLWCEEIRWGGPARLGIYRDCSDSGVAHNASYMFAHVNLAGFLGMAVVPASSIVEQPSLGPDGW